MAGNSDAAKGVQESISFQELWRITVGRSCMKNVKLVTEELQSKLSTLRKCLKYFIPYSKSSQSKVKNNETSSDRQKFIIMLSEFLNLDCLQTAGLVEQYVTCIFHGSSEKFEELLKDERNYMAFLGKITEYYFTERLYFLRIIKHIISHFEDETHNFQKGYSEIVNSLKNLGNVMLSLYEDLFNSELPSSKTRGSCYTPQMLGPFAVQMLKEQSEILEILFLYYSSYTMETQVLLQFAKVFKGQGFGAGHPLLEVADASILSPYLARMNALQQIILIQGLDMDYLQRLAEIGSVEQHRLAKEKKQFQELNKIFATLPETQELSPLLLSWATVRYQVLDGKGSELTQKMGERSIEHKVWWQIAQMIEIYGPEFESPVALSARNVLRGVLSCVTHSFHEDTLGDYSDLVSVSSVVLRNASKAASEAFWLQKKSGTGLHLLLNSAAGYLPLNLEPLLKLLTSLASGKNSAHDVFSYICNLPSAAEFLAARGTDDVESAEDGSYWKLLTHKNLALASGYHYIKIPSGTIGTLVETPIGAMVQWQTPVDGWKYFAAEIQSVLQYRGQSSDLEVLGYVYKASLIYGLVEKLLSSLSESDDLDLRKRILNHLDPLMSKICPLVQRLINMVQPPLGLIGICICCLTSWVKCDPPAQNVLDPTSPSLDDNANLISVVTSLSRIQFLPFSNQNFMSNLDAASKIQMNFASSMSTPIYPGIYGNLLVNVERPVGRYPVTVATLDLILTLVERSISWESDELEGNAEINFNLVVSAIAPCVLYFLNEVFPTFHQWRRDPETSDKIGLKCLTLCHKILRSYDPKGASSFFPDDSFNKATYVARGIWAPVQHTTLQILTHSHSADIILKLVSVPVDTVDSLLSAEPSSPIVNSLLETIRFGFSVLNNILRLEHSIVKTENVDEKKGGSKLEEQQLTYLHNVLSAHSAGAPNLTSLVAGYLYHHHSVPLTRIAVSLLRRISISVPMSLHASLGADVEAVRDILLTRLRSRTEDLHLKIGILEFLTVSVQTQPGLFELFLDLKPVVKDKPEKGLTLGKYSCLTAVLDMIHTDKQGTFQLPNELHSACVKLLSSLWVDKRHSALQALRTYASTSKTKTCFWHSLLLPLFSDNSPKDLALSDLLETCAHILNTVGLENFYTTPEGKDPALAPFMKEFAAKDRYNHWSKVLICVSKTLPKLNEIDAESRILFIAAWRTFLLTSKMKDPKLTKKFIDDAMMALSALVSEIDVNSSMATALNLTSSLLLTLMHRSPENTLPDYSTTEVTLERVIDFLKGIGRSKGTLNRSRVHCHAIALQLLSKLKSQKRGRVKFSESVSNWLRMTCLNLQDILKGNELTGKNIKSTVQTSLLLIQTLQDIFLINGHDKQDAASWLEIIIEQSTLNLLSFVLMKLITSAHQEDDSAALRTSLGVAILRLYCLVSKHQESAFAILRTGVLAEFCLKISNAYADSTVGKLKKWVGLYHLSLLFMQTMLDSLSHNFIDHALDFVGVNSDRIIQCLDAVRMNQSPQVLREATCATSFLSSLSRNFVRNWRFKLLHSFQLIIESVKSLCHSCVAMLLRPRYLQDVLEFSSKKDASGSKLALLTKQGPGRHTSVASQKSVSQDELESPTPKFVAAQHALFSILGNCLAIFKHLSPDICQISLDQCIDLEEFQPLLLIGFSNPSLDQVSHPTFGTVVSASNIAWKVLSKSTSPGLHDIATYVMDTALTVAISQGSLLLKHPLVSPRDKQRLRRELGDELISFLRSANRHYRHSSGGVVSPQSSPSAGSKITPSGRTPVKQFPSSSQHSSSSTPNVDKGMMDLVHLFVKDVLR